MERSAVMRDEQGNVVETDRSLLGVSLRCLVDEMARKAADRESGDVGSGDERYNGRKA